VIIPEQLQATSQHFGKYFAQHFRNVHDLFDKCGLSEGFFQCLYFFVGTRHHDSEASPALASHPLGITLRRVFGVVLIFLYATYLLMLDDVIKFDELNAIHELLLRYNQLPDYCYTYYYPKKYLDKLLEFLI
jgi:hypothetical protein